MEREILLTKEAADILRVSEEYLRELIRAGRIKAYKEGRRGGYRIARSEINKYVKSKHMEREKNIFDKVGALIPGYRGYAEREGRRQCDKLLREKIASILERSEEIIGSRIDDSISVKNTDKMRKLEIDRKRINTLVAKIKFAPYGASAFFSNSQIKEAELEEIYRKDLKMLGKVNILNTDVKKKEPQEVLAKIADIEEILEQRNQFIKEFK